jgi:nucleoid DNA-binding protein
MTPHRSSKLYKIVSEDLNTSEALVESIVEHYYKDLRDALINLKYERVNVPGLGHFVIKHPRVRSSIEKFTATLRTHDVSTFKAYFNKKGLEEKLDRLIELDRILKEQKESRKKFKQGNEGSIESNLGE